MIHVEAACSLTSLHDHLRAPVRVGAWRCGTDGTWLLASRDDRPAPECHEHTASIIRRWLEPLTWDVYMAAGGEREHDTAQLRELCGRPRMPVPCGECEGYARLPGACDACGGTGRYLGESEHQRCAECACGWCDAEGYWWPTAIERVLRVGEHHYDCALVASALVHVEAPSVRLRQAGEVLVLRWDEGAAAVMRCQPGEAARVRLP